MVGAPPAVLPPAVLRLVSLQRSQTIYSWQGMGKGQQAPSSGILLSDLDYLAIFPYFVHFYTILDYIDYIII